MEELKPQEKKIDYAKIKDMCESEGWKIIEGMLNKDASFAYSLMFKPKPINGDTKQEFEQRWLKDEHSVGFAQGLNSIVQKYLAIANRARNRNIILD